jgi:hypothetical protein
VQTALNNHSMAVFDQLGFPFTQNASALIGQAPRSAITAQLTHSSEQLDGGTKIQVGAGRDPWQSESLAQPYNSVGDPNDQVPADYFALQTQNKSGSERFAGINANPGWFFGVYADSFISPDATNDDSSFAAPWLRFARQGWSSGGAIELGQGKLRMGVFEGSASWNHFQPTSEHRGNGAMMEYSFPAAGYGYSLSIQSGFVSERDTFLGTELGKALGQLENSETFFAGINGHLQIKDNWQGLFALYSGTTDSGLTSASEVNLSNSLFNINDSILSKSWSLGLSGHSLLQANDQLSIYQIGRAHV